MPPWTPRWIAISPSDSSSRNASRTVARPSPDSRVSSTSEGSSVPGGMPSPRMRARSSLANRMEALGARRPRRPSQPGGSPSAGWDAVPDPPAAGGLAAERGTLAAAPGSLDAGIVLAGSLSPGTGGWLPEEEECAAEARAVDDMRFTSIVDRTACVTGAVHASPLRPGVRVMKIIPHGQPVRLADHLEASVAAVPFRMQPISHRVRDLFEARNRGSLENLALDGLEVHQRLAVNGERQGLQLGRPVIPPHLVEERNAERRRARGRDALPQSAVDTRAPEPAPSALEVAGAANGRRAAAQFQGALNVEARHVVPGDAPEIGQSLERRRDRIHRDLQRNLLTIVHASHRDLVVRVGTPDVLVPIRHIDALARGAKCADREVQVGKVDDFLSDMQ